MSSAKTLLILGLSLLLGACAGGPTLRRQLAVVPGQGTVIAYQNRDGLNLSVVNQSSLTAVDAQRQRQSDPNLKVIPDAEVQYLLDALAALEYFALAESTRDPQASAWIIVSQGKTTYFTSNHQATEDQVARFLQCFEAFNHVRNRNRNFEGSKLTAADLEKAARDTNEGSQAIREKKVKRRNQNP